MSARVAPDRSDHVLTALVVDSDTTARRQVAGLLALAGWEVREAADLSEALCLATVFDLDLLVTSSSVAGTSAPELLAEVRRVGSTARFLVTGTDLADQLRADCAAAGALACLPQPVDAGVLLDLVLRRSTAPAVVPGTRDVVEVDDPLDADLDDALLERLHGIYDDALPTRLTAITSSAAEGDRSAVAAAAITLAGTSGQLGHPDVAEICRAIASDARRGIVAHHLVADLAELAVAAEAAAGRITGDQQRSRLARIQAARA
jgi:DNA-binding response OmpR family regulator